MNEESVKILETGELSFLPEIIKIYNSVYSNCEGYAERTEEFYDWSVRKRVSACPKRYYYAFKGERLVGYGFLSFTMVVENLVSAQILEICALPGNESVIKEIISKMERDAKSAGAAVLETTTSLRDPAHRAYEDLNYVEYVSSAYVIGITSKRFIKTVMERAIKENVEALEKKYKGKFLIVLKETAAGQSTFSGNVGLIIDGDASRVVDDTADYDAKIEMDMKTFARIFLREEKMSTLSLARGIKVRPLRNFMKCLGLLRALSIDIKWHVPYTDIF
jgi:hypothetical protein